MPNLSDDSDLDNVAGGASAALLDTATAAGGAPVILGLADTAAGVATASAKSCICLSRGYGY